MSYSLSRNNLYEELIIKGVSPLIATVLLIAFTIAVGGLISIWLTGFTQTTTQSVGTQASNSITCSNGGITLSSLGYCNGNLTGIITNIGSISLGNLTLTVIFTNSSNTQVLYLKLLGSTVNATPSCCANLSLSPSMIQSFNFTIGGSNYNLFRLTSNCTGVLATADSSSVPVTC